jgi:extradiol dioxygenase family protein
MTKKRKNDKPAKYGQRHPLLLHQHLNEQNFWVGILIVALVAGLLIWNPPKAAGYRPYLFVVLTGTGGILILTFIYRLRSYVQCRENAICVQSPFFHLAIPYSTIRATRPNEFARLFPPKEQRWTQRYFLRWLWGTTVIVVDLEQLPAPRPWLQLRMGKYLLDPNEASLVLPVRDWIAFRNELDEFLSRYRRSIPK